MLLEYLNLLFSPCCFAPLEAQINKCRFSNIIEEGRLVCQRCKKSYPIHQGIPYLCVIDSQWDVILQELIARRNLTSHSFKLNTKPDEQYAALHQQQTETAASIMAWLFQESLKEMPIQPGTLILDVGAGLCETAAHFADKGAVVFATETEPANLHYLSFEGLDEMPPRSLKIGDQTFFEKNPTPHKNYFNRIVCNAQRLCFAPNSFDYVFCRSMLHHLQGLGTAIREMVRVTKPGGKIVFCSEPLRSMIDSEEQYIEEVVESQEGLNERCPNLLNYLWPLGLRVRDITIQYWRRPPGPATQAFIKLLPFNWDSHFFDGEKAKRRKLIKLLITSASMNLFAIKKAASRKETKPWPDSAELFNAEELAQIYAPPSLEEAIASFDADTETLKKMRRQIIAEKGRLRAKTRILPAQEKSFNLPYGWGKRYVVEGKKCRAIFHLALYTLARPAKVNTLQLHFFALAQPDQPQTISLMVNSKPIKQQSLSSSGWQVLEAPLPSGEEKIIDLEIALDKLLPLPPSIEPKSGPHLGALIHSIILK